MTYSVVHQCPKCELRFSFRTELEHHLRVDHPAPVTAGRAAVNAAEVPAASALLLVAPPAVTSRRRVGARRRLPVVGLLVVFAAALLVAYSAISLSTSATAIIAVAVFMVVASYARRSRGRPRVPRR